MWNAGSRTRSWVTCAVLGAALVVGCGSTPEPGREPAPVVSRASTDDVPSVPSISSVRAGDGGWTPEADLLRRAAALGDVEDEDAVDARLDGWPDAERVAVLRAGLRLDESAHPSAARRCAARLEWGEVDGWESARVVELLPADYVVQQPDYGVFDRMRQILGSDDVPHFVEQLPPLPWEHDPRLLGALHRMLRDTHIPPLTDAALRAPPEIAEILAGELVVAAAYTDRYRETYGRFLLRDQPVHPDERNLEAGGLPATLRRGLRHALLDPPADEASEKPMSRSLDWWVRWLRDTPPTGGDTASDREFRLRLARHVGLHSAPEWVRAVVLLQLGRTGGDAAEAFLRELADDEGTGETDRTLAVLALALRGDAESLDVAREWAREARVDHEPDDEGLEIPERTSYAWAVLLEVDPAAVVAALEADLRDAEVAGGVLDGLEEALEIGRTAGVRLQLDRLARLADVACTLEDPFVVLAIGARVPGCATRRLVGHAAARLPLVTVDRLREHAWAFEGVAGGLLEVVEREALLAALRRAAAEPDVTGDEDRDETAVDGAASALELLVLLNDPEFPPSLLPRLDDVRVDVWSEDVRGWTSPALAGYYAGRLRDAPDDRAGEFAMHLGIAHGLAPALARAFLLSETRPSPEVVERLLAGDAAEALVRFVEEHPDDVIAGTGLHPDPRIAAHLQSVRTRRELGLYWNATAELSLHGDPEAREEYRTALRIGRYRVVDQGTLLQRTFGLDLDAVPPLLDELRSNCCRVITHGNGDLTRLLFDVDGFAPNSVARRTAYDRVRDVWDAADGLFVWSRVAYRLVAVPR